MPKKLKDLLLVMDVGNTNIVLGVYDGPVRLCDWRIRTERDATLDELGIFIRNLFISRDLGLDQVGQMIISCVVPPMLYTLEEFGKRYFNLRPFFVGPGIKTGMPIFYDNPKEVGADRIVNAVAAYEKYRTNLIVVDFGTATTFDYVSEKGEYLGGAIAPGILISCEALFQKASKLPRVEIFTKPKTVSGQGHHQQYECGYHLRLHRSGGRTGPAHYRFGPQKTKGHRHRRTGPVDCL